MKKNAKKHSQYYTKIDISSAMTSLIPSDISIKKCLDLGVGEGSLLSSAKSLWPNAHYVGIDIDLKNTTYIAKNKPFIKAYNLDTSDIPHLI